jgi:hypothetical protein
VQNFPNNFPASYYSSSPPPVQKKERGAFFTIVLAIATVWNFISTLVVVTGGAALDRAVQSAADQSANDLATQGVRHTLTKLVAVLAVFQVAQLVSVCGMWAWKRWAVMGYFVTSIMAALAFVKMNDEVPMWSLVWMGIMLVAVFPRLGMFED